LTPQELYQLAIQHHQAGRLREAEALYRQVLAAQPAFGDALANLGFVLVSTRRLPEAISCYQQAVTQRPNSAAVRYGLAYALQQDGRLDEAIAAYQQAIRLQPNYPEAYNNIANIHRTLGRFEPAIASYRQAIALRPNHVESIGNLAGALQEAGRLDEALAAASQAVSLRPQSADLHMTLGQILKDKGKFPEAIAALQRVIALQPDSVQAYNVMGNVLQEMGRLDEAIGAYQQALALQPDYHLALSNLGVLFNRKGLLDEAVASVRKALAINPRFTAGWSNLGNALREQGDIDGAIDAFRRGVELSADSREVGNLVYALHFHPEYTPQRLYEEHAKWNQIFAEPLAGEIRPHTNNRSTGRRLRIGYVSPDFRTHPVGRFMVPLLANHDHQQFEIFCYAEMRRPDVTTSWFQSRADVWRHTVGLSDAHLADLVRNDGIDILVDLTMHMEFGRLLTFARKPAPVQAAYLAYCGTTGLRTMDYRLSDPYLDPPGNPDEQWYTEKTIRLPRTYWCYPPHDNVPAVSPLPALSAGYVTFGCLNTYAKVTPQTWEAWLQLLRAVNRSKLIVHSAQGSHRKKAHDWLAAQGIDPARVLFVGRMRTSQYFQQYSQIDIGLDPFPYTGGTTTCDALWMGVPVVTRTGQTAVSRSGSSILSNVGMPELIASSTEDYVRIAAALASDVPRLSEIRNNLRQRMERSALMDGPAFARDIEAAFRKMWHEWCAKP
jgi:predicted O-linked N-acetylglucosamine transferase (SPINDLY family)